MTQHVCVYPCVYLLYVSILRKILSNSHPCKMWTNLKKSFHSEIYVILFLFKSSILICNHIWEYHLWLHELVKHIFTGLDFKFFPIFPDIIKNFYIWRKIFPNSQTFRWLRKNLPNSSRCITGVSPIVFRMLTICLLDSIICVLDLFAEYNIRFSSKH